MSRRKAGIGIRALFGLGFGYKTSRPSRRISYDGRMKEDINSDWFPYTAAAAIAAAIAMALWLFSFWFG
jgi:hypothetical protein